jgi:hypothetical protein
MAGLKFRVLLDSKDKNETFRDIVIRDNDNFESFYLAILGAYHFGNDQMASFYMSNDQWDKGHEISLFDMALDEDSAQILPSVMRTSMISSYLKEADQKIILVHDFIRMWIFLIELIGIEDQGPEKPKVVLSVGNAPAEDSKKGDDDSIQFETESDLPDDEDEFGFGEFESGYDGFDY